jgi:hypothetical protein
MDLGDRFVAALVAIAADLLMFPWVIGGGGRDSPREVVVEVAGDGIRIKKFDIILRALS